MSYPYYLPTTPGVPQEVIAQVDNAVWIAHVLFISSIAVAVWDWMSCLLDEYRWIWKRPFTAVSVIYLWTRYGFFISSGIAIWIWLGGQDAATCQKRFLVAPAAMASVELSAMAVLGLRTFAVWRKAWYIAAICISLMLTYIGLQVYIEMYYFDPVPIFRSQGACIAAGKPKSPAALYFAWPLIYDVIITILLFIKLIPIARSIDKSATLQRLFREGALYAALMSCVNAANTALLASNLLNNALLVSVSFVLQANLTSRMILSLRASGDSQESGMETRSFWSRVHKASNNAPAASYNGRVDPALFSVNVTKFEETVVDVDGNGDKSYELELQEKSEHGPSHV